MTLLMLCAVGLPLLGASLVPGPARLLRVVLPAAALPALLLVLVSDGGDKLVLPYLFQGAVWSLEGPRRVFLLMTAVLWLAAGIHAAGYIAGEKLRRFSLFWLLALAGNLGLVLSQDVTGFYSFFALMTFAAYGLVIHDGTAASAYAGRVYLVMALLGEMLLLGGLLMACRAADSLMLADLPGALAGSANGALTAGLLWLGFGVKAGLPLLHFWLPLAHPVAPAPASAVLSGAMIKAGLLGWLLVLPLGETVPAYWGMVVAVAGGVAALGGAALGLCQRSPKAVLAYSSISQMGLMTLLLGAGLGNPALAPGLATVIAFYALHHGLAKGALFLSTSLKLPNGAGPRLLVGMLVTLPALSLAGLPLTSGAVAKLLAKDALPSSPWWGVMLAAGAVATTLLVLRFIQRLAAYARSGANPAPVLAGWLLAAGLSVLGAGWMPWLAGLLDAPALRSWGSVWSLTWPLLAAGLITGLAWRAGLRLPSISPGDGIVWLRESGRWIVGLARRAGVYAGARFERKAPPASWATHLVMLRGRAEAAEHGMRREAGLVFLAFVVLTAILLW